MRLKKQKRQEKLLEIIRTKRITNHLQLIKEMERTGISTVQSSISRDLVGLGVLKINGVYRLPSIEKGESSVVDFLEVSTAGDNIVVLKSPTGQASMVAVIIDRAKIPEVVGTLAGDDTVFMAVKNRSEQAKTIKQVFQLFKID